VDPHTHTLTHINANHPGVCLAFDPHNHCLQQPLLITHSHKTPAGHLYELPSTNTFKRCISRGTTFPTAMFHMVSIGSHQLDANMTLVYQWPPTPARCRTFL